MMDRKMDAEEWEEGLHRVGCEGGCGAQRVQRQEWHAHYANADRTTVNLEETRVDSKGTDANLEDGRARS